MENKNPSLVILQTEGRVNKIIHHGIDISHSRVYFLSKEYREKAISFMLIRSMKRIQTDVSFSNQIGNIHWHFLYLCIVKLFDVT